MPSTQPGSGAYQATFNGCDSHDQNTTRYLVDTGSCNFPFITLQALTFTQPIFTSCRRRWLRSTCIVSILIKNKYSLNTIDFQCLFNHVPFLLLKILFPSYWSSGLCTHTVHDQPFCLSDTSLYSSGRIENNGRATPFNSHRWALNICILIIIDRSVRLYTTLYAHLLPVVTSLR